VEHYLARNATYWYYSALTVAAAINIVMFFWGSTDMESSIACPTVEEDVEGFNCTNRKLFHWVNQGWSPDIPGYCGASCHASLCMAELFRSPG
jgi:hypothetical protein